MSLQTYSSFSIGVETNDKGFIGFINELPGAFVRGLTEEEALEKVALEVRRYYRWLDNDPPETVSIDVTQRIFSLAVVEDGDTQILLNADKGECDRGEFDFWLSLLMQSAETFEHLIEKVKHPGWVDPSRAGSCFYGLRPASIRDINNHVRRTQYYYLSRLGLYPEQSLSSFSGQRREFVDLLRGFYIENNNRPMFNHEREYWTLKKVLRRFLWHDRIHGKSITKILSKQKRLGLIDVFNDPLYYYAD
ncbi:MAG: hypothetical protein GY841_13020 [FCB group bacterium]|nr:hypothetical protein [FCB group bacterium]